MRAGNFNRKEVMPMQNDSGYLIHYGIKGQKHGVRRFQEKDGTLTAAGRERYGVGEARAKLVKAKTSAGEKLKAAAQTVGKVAGKAGKAAGYQVRKKTNQLSDQELQTEVKRLQLEKQYKDLHDSLHGRKNQGNSNHKSLASRAGKMVVNDLSTVIKKPIMVALGLGMTAIMKKKVSDWLQAHAYNRLPGS